jgi:hypothetical protein
MVFCFLGPIINYEDNPKNILRYNGFPNWYLIRTVKQKLILIPVILPAAFV